MKSEKEIRDTLETVFRTAQEIPSEREGELSAEWSGMFAAFAALSWAVGDDKFEFMNLVDQLRGVDVKRDMSEG